MTGTMSLFRALRDLKAEVIAGESSEACAATIASEHGVNPVLLLRKFGASFGGDQALRATALATDPKTVLAKHIADAIARACARYKVAPDGVKEITFRDKRYVAIGRLSYRTARPIIAVCREDGRTYQLPDEGVRMLRP